MAVGCPGGGGRATSRPTGQWKPVPGRYHSAWGEMGGSVTTQCRAQGTWPLCAPPGWRPGKRWPRLSPRGTLAFLPLPYSGCRLCPVPTRTSFTSFSRGWGTSPGDRDKHEGPAGPPRVHHSWQEHHPLLPQGRQRCSLLPILQVRGEARQAGHPGTHPSPHRAPLAGPQHRICSLPSLGPGPGPPTLTEIRVTGTVGLGPGIMAGVGGV